MVPFAMQKLLSLIRSHLFIFAFFSLLPWETDLGKHWYDLCQRMFCLCSLLEVLCCHVLYSSLIFVNGVRVCSNFIDLQCCCF